MRDAVILTFKIPAGNRQGDNFVEEFISINFREVFFLISIGTVRPGTAITTQVCAPGSIYHITTIRRDVQIARIGDINPAVGPQHHLFKICGNY